MLNKIKNAFPKANSNDCLHSITNREFHIYDHSIHKRCYVQNDPDDIQHFKVVNDTEQPIHFLAIDKCLFMDYIQTQRCDCAVFDEYTFCFIEIKTTSSEKDRRIAKCRKKASDQLMATILHFKNEMTFDGCRLEAYITLVTESTILGNNADELEEEVLPKPRIRANLIEMVAKFNEIGVTLYYDNIKRFA